ncbi:hypothetical protein PR048_028502 [Dryococelus australis]|uniref:Uncharacterized protein n=1 Tax=Dryococelus australis TaxID=614101 RepID=A0ABQ9GAT9_9NEOP|nr:hypothetical protein PR048_028502 [Dryococelus australis]
MLYVGYKDRRVNGVTHLYRNRYVENCPDNFLAERCDSAFTTKRYTNWKKALKKFKANECSDSHLQEVLSCKLVTEGLPINAQLKTSLVGNQECAYKCLLKILSTVKFLARQGLAFRGHQLGEGNFQQLLQMRAEDCPELKSWLKRKLDWCSPDIQNEMLQLLANELVRRYVDEKLSPVELFVVLHDADSTTGEAISNIMFDVLIRLQLSGPQQTLTGMEEAVSLIKDSFTTLRSEREFQHIVVGTDSFTKEHDLKYLQVPRQKKPPKRFSGPAEFFKQELLRNIIAKRSML